MELKSDSPQSYQRPKQEEPLLGKSLRSKAQKTQIKSSFNQQSQVKTLQKKKKRNTFQATRKMKTSGIQRTRMKTKTHKILADKDLDLLRRLRCFHRREQTTYESNTQKAKKNSISVTVRTTKFFQVRDSGHVARFSARSRSTAKRKEALFIYQLPSFQIRALNAQAGLIQSRETPKQLKQTLVYEWQQGYAHFQLLATHYQI